MPAQWVDVNSNGNMMESYLTRPEVDGPHPAVIVIQEVFGVNSHVQSIANRFPSQGYVALAPAMFHREGRMTVGLYEELPVAFDRMGRCSDANIIADVRAAVDYLKSQPYVRGDRIGIVGFCFGGRVSYLAAANISDIRASAFYYGGKILHPLTEGDPSPLDQTANINASMIGFFGEEDQNPSPDDMKAIEAELKRHGKNYEVHSYEGAGHGFLCEDRQSYHPESAKDAWAKTMAWFDKHLKS